MCGRFTGKAGDEIYWQDDGFVNSACKSLISARDERFESRPC